MHRGLSILTRAALVLVGLLVGCDGVPPPGTDRAPLSPPTATVPSADPGAPGARILPTLSRGSVARIAGCSFRRDRDDRIGDGFGTDGVVGYCVGVTVETAPLEIRRDTHGWLLTAPGAPERTCHLRDGGRDFEVGTI